ncbi:MAG: phage portal protein, partial [Candidatus Brocadiales bacterium]|nr:phage portal protein [Candidatus Brocadiales bacterium]
MAQNTLKFPYPDHKDRLAQYEHYENLFKGNHFDAFAIKVDNEQYGKIYRKLRYIAVNFAGLLSKVMADFLFSEPPTFKADDGDQEFIDALVQENGLNVQNYESALSNSFEGDAVYKLRIGKRNAGDKKPTIIIEDIQPKIYFPHTESMNVRANPEKEEIAYLFEHGSKKYLYQEIQTPGLIEYKVFLMNGDEIAAEVDPKEVGLDLPESEKTLIDRNLIIHVPNWKTGSSRFGISDYFDLETLFYAINNRITKIDNILDKHSDPILAIPEGILDEDGSVKRESLNMIEVPDGSTGKQGKPEYIVWNANLDSAIEEIDKLIEFLFMISETSPDILGMGKGISDSGRALKLKLIRTMAKAQRKRLYYDKGLKEVLYIAQLLAKAH